MTPQVAELIRAGLALDPDERVMLADQLIASLDDEQAALDAAWLEDVTRRLKEVRDGSAELVDADDHYTRLRAQWGSTPPMTSRQREHPDAVLELDAAVAWRLDG